MTARLRLPALALVAAGFCIALGPLPGGAGAPIPRDTPARPATPAPSRPAAPTPSQPATPAPPAPAGRKAATPTRSVGVTVQVIRGNSVAYENSLGQNFPNMFVSSTVIRYSLARASKVAIVVYSITGQRVATLIDGYQNAGAYALRWNARADDGRRLPPGTYIYQMTGVGRPIAKKMVLIR